MSGRIYYVSDYHFDHELARNRSRSDWFSDVPTMNEALIERHNRKVTSEDTVYILGDLVVCEEDCIKERLEQTIGKLNGHLHLILGNHDYKYADRHVFDSYFESINESAIIKDEGRWVQMYHYPVLCWYRKHKGAYHVYGHLHNETKGKEFPILCGEEKALNACVEVTDYEPCTLEELVRKNMIFREKVADLLAP